MAVHVLIHLNTGKMRDTCYHLIMIHMSRADVARHYLFLLHARPRGCLFYVSTDKAIRVLSLTLKSSHGQIFDFVLTPTLRQKIAN